MKPAETYTHTHTSKSLNVCAFMKRLGVMLVAIMMCGNSWAYEFHLDDEALYAGTSSRCRSQLGSYSSLDKVTITALSGDTYTLLSAPSIPHACYATGAVADYFVNIGDSDVLMAFYDSTYKKIVVPRELSSNYPYSYSWPASVANLSLPAIIFGTVDSSGVTVTIDQGQVLVTLGCSDVNATGDRIMMSAIIEMVAQWTISMRYIGVPGVTGSTCVYDACKNGTPLGGYTIDSSVCCKDNCPANQYGNGCSCTPCPTMVNKAGQTVQGVSTKGENGTIGKCTMGTDQVFTDATGDWSFETACAAD